MDVAPRTCIDLMSCLRRRRPEYSKDRSSSTGAVIRLTAAAQRAPVSQAGYRDRPSQSHERSTRQGVGSIRPSLAGDRIRKATDGIPSIATAASDDEAVRFVKGVRANSFEVTEGVTMPVSEMTFQTGTTAGTIVFTAEVGGWTATASVDIAPERVHIDKVRAVKNGSMLEVEITGFRQHAQR